MSPSVLRSKLLAPGLVVLASAWGTSLQAAEQPNVLLLLVDDLKPSFGAYGQTRVHSPNLDRLAVNTDGGVLTGRQDILKCVAGGLGVD